jgi:hypothetical protein
MRSLVKVFRTLIYWTWEFITFLSMFFCVEAAFRGNFALCGAFVIIAILMRMELDKIRDWAEKY